MRILTAAIGTALVLGGLGTSSASAQTRHRHVYQTRERIYVTPSPGTNAYWDSNVVPRYRYRPEDDRVDLCAGPVEPVISYGAQQTTVPPWVANALHLSGLQGRDWPCRGQHR